MKYKKMFFFVEIIFILINVVNILILLDIFKNSFFLFQGGLLILAIATAIVGLIFDFFNKEVGRKIKLFSSFLTIFFYFIYYFVDPEVSQFFIIISLVTLFVFILLKTIVKKYTYVLLIYRNVTDGKYIKITKKLLIYLLLNIFVILIIWIYPFERDFHIFEGPNGEGLSSYTNGEKEPKLSIDIDGGFIYNIIDKNTFKRNNNININNLLNVIDIKSYKPNVKAKIISYSSGTIIVNLLNFSSEKSIITINGEKIKPEHSNNGFYDKSKIYKDNQIIGDLVKNSYLNTYSNEYIILNVVSNKEYIINIEPKNKDKSWNFYTISDLHGGINVIVPVLRRLINKDSDFIIANGDLVNNGDKSEYMIIGELFNSYNVPIYTSIGNHDVWSSGRKYYPSFFGPLYYSFTYNNATFIILNTSSGLIGESQFIWLENELKNANTELIFIIGHMSPINTVSGKFDNTLNISPESNHSIQSKAESDRILALCDKYNVDYYIAGHSHINGSSKINNTTYITSGVLGGTAQAGQNIGFLNVKVNDDKVNIKFIDSSNYYNKSILKQMQAIQVFLIPILRGNSIKLLITLTIIILNYVLWLVLKKKIIYNVDN